MTKEEFKKELKNLNLTIAEFSQFIGRTQRMFDGKNEIPFIYTQFIKLLKENKELKEQVEAKETTIKNILSELRN